VVGQALAAFRRIDTERRTTKAAKPRVWTEAAE
jgi:hypothetical protein